MTPNDVQRFDEPTQHSAQRVENACDRLTYSQRWTQGWTQSRTRWTRIFANRPRRDVVRATHQDERSDMHTGLTNATSAPAIGAEGLLRAPVRARGRGYPPISSAATGARWGKNSRVDPGTGVARTRLSSEKPGPDFFFFGKIFDRLSVAWKRGLGSFSAFSATRPLADHLDSPASPASRLEAVWRFEMKRMSAPKRGSPRPIRTFKQPRPAPKQSAY
jgi:hypothetical protein